MIGPARHHQVNIRNFGVYAKSRSSCVAANRAMADADIGRFRSKLEANLIAEAVSCDYFAEVFD